MKRVMSIALCFVLLLSCAIPAMAANDVPEEVMEATKSVVRILSQYRKGATTGSGFVIKNEPGEVLIATNNHVVEDNPTSISVWVAEDELVEAEIVFTTAKKDLCVLKITDSVDMQPLTLSKEDARQGQAVYAVGYPGVGDILSDSVAHTSEAATITDGIISAIRTFTIEEGADPTKLLQINAAINPGNSGGPLFNAKGEVIGVNTYKVNKDSQGIFGAVDISELWTLLRRNGIEIPEETVPETEPETEPEPATAPKPFPVGIAVGAAGALVLLVVVIILAIRKKPKRKNHKQKTQQIVTLLEYLQNYPQGLGIGGAVSLLLPAGIALRNYHNDGKLHLEICPENILVGDYGATLKNPSGQEAGRFHSGFAAPEVYKGAGYGITSDIYSFGAVLYFAVTGKVPANSLQQDVLEEDFHALENAAFAQVLRKSMAANVQDRTQSMQELIYSIAVFNVPEEAPKAAAQVVEDVPASVAEAPVVVPVAETVKETPIAVKAVKPQKEVKKLGKILMPIGAVLACGAIAAVVLLWKPIVKPEDPRVAATQETQVPTETAVPLTPEEAAYAEAEELLAAEETAKAAIAFGKLGDYSDARERSFELWRKISPPTVVSTNSISTAAVRKDGTVVLAGYKDYRQLQCQEWTDIIAVSTCAGHTVGLKNDGTVVAVGANLQNQCNTSSWTDIVAIDTYSYYLTVGLKADGTVLYTGQPLDFEHAEIQELSSWKDIAAIDIVGGSVFGIKLDGTIVAARISEYGVDGELFKGWSDIIAISSRWVRFEGFFYFGLKADGTVICNNDALQSEVSHWSDIVAIDAAMDSVIGLKSDGTVVSTGTFNEKPLNVSEWSDIAAISACTCYVIGVKNDGSVVFTGDLDDVAIVKNGTALVNNWSDIKIPN